MKNKGIVIFLIALAVIIVTVVSLDYISSKPGELPANPYALGMDLFSRTDTALIMFNEKRNLTINFSEPTGLCISNGKIFVVGDQKLQIIEPNGNLLKEINFELKPTCVFASPDNIYIGFRKSLTILNREGLKIANCNSFSDSTVITSITERSGIIFVADAGKRIVRKFDQTGKPVGEIEGKSGNDQIHGFIIPSPYFDLAFNDSSIYVLTNDWPGLNKRKLLDILNRPVDAGSITGDINICQGEDLVTFVVPKIDNATSYIWTLPNNTIETTNTNSISVHFDSTSISGYISVTGNNSFGNGSISKLYINIIPQTFTPNILGNPNPQPYSEELYSVSQQLGKTYNWTVTNGNILNGLGTNYINVQWGNTGFGQVNVNVVDTNNSICSYSPFLKVNIGNVGIESLANNGVSIYPNPFIEELTIETNSDKVQRLEILNLMGQTVYTSYINNKKTTINTSAFANGVYILKLYTDKETVVRKFIKE